MMPQWILTVTVTVKYLINLDLPVVEWEIHYTTVNTSDNNHALAECLHKNEIPCNQSIWYNTPELCCR